MARKRRVPQEEKVGEVNMTPMIDVVFQLLIFFMLSMHFKEVEGKLITTLPKDKGLMSSHVLTPELQEIRIILCAEGDTRTHAQDKGKHEQKDKNPEMCRAMVEGADCGELFMTEKKPDRVGPNRGVYKQIGQKCKDLDAIRPSSRDPSKKSPIIIDADSETPYEHVIGVINELKIHNLENIEFAGNPRFDLYYGSQTKGQFKRK